MQFLSLAAALVIPLQVAAAAPVAKVISLLSDLQAKVIAEGDVAHKEFKEFSEWCEDRSRNLDFEIKTGKSQAEELGAVIDQENALSLSLTTKVEELASGISVDEADLKAATEIRGKEAADFAAEEKELVECVNILQRAIQILEREMQGGGASMMQLNNVGNLAQALSVMVQASMIGTSDAAKLTAFVQAAQNEDDDADSQGAPAASVYKSHSQGIVDTLEDLLEKAETQLDASRKKETSATHNYQMLKQSLQDEIAVANGELSEAKKSIAGSSERKSTAESDKQVNARELSTDIDVKASLHQDCMTRAQDFEAETKSRGEELKTLAEAKKLLQESLSASLEQTSFLQISRMSLGSSEDLANFEAVRFVRDLARKQHSPLLAQLASRMATVIRSEAADPFEKVKSLIRDMIVKLEDEAGQDATKKAYCDKELKETNTKKIEKTAEVEKLGTRIDQMAARSASLKEEVSALQGELAKLAKSQAEMDKMRSDEHNSFVSSKAEQEKSLSGIKMALKVLKEYYAKDDISHDAAQGSSSGIIGLLETCESDVTKTLAGLMTEEDQASAEYESMSHKNAIEKATKESSVKYKVKEHKQLDETIAEDRADRSGVQSELDAVLEYLAKIEEQCIAKAEPYAERERRREAEIAGLKEALQILRSETAFLQRVKKGHGTLRGHY